MISLHAGVASSALDTRPDHAREALSTIRSAARTVLTDIGGLMSVLRADDRDETSALRPQPGLARLGTLVAEFADTGLTVEVSGAAPAKALSPPVDHVAYLAVQEGLTKAQKHGGEERTELDLHTTGSILTVTVRKPRRGGVTTAPANGHGLRGLEEQTAAVRGSADSGPVGDFHLVVRLPLEPEGAS